MWIYDSYVHYPDAAVWAGLDKCGKKINKARP
jgi:hypothetical protein